MILSLLASIPLQISQEGQPGGIWMEQHRISGQQSGEFYGLASAWIGDINGDGCDEWLAGALYADHGPGGNHGRAEVVDGRTGVILRTYIGNPYDVRLGSRVARCGDMDRDLVPDYLISQFGSGVVEGKVFAYSGATGGLIREFASPIPAGGVSDFGARGLDSGRDVTGDGVPEVFVGDPLYSTPGLIERLGKVYCFDGASGVIVWESVGATLDDYFGMNLVLPGDLEGDGAEELLVSSSLNPGYGTIHVLDAHTGLEKWSIVGPRSTASIGASAGNWPIIGVGDADLDGLPDFAYEVSSIFSSDPPPSVLVVRGFDAAVILELRGEQWFDDFGESLASAGDVDNDGYPDIFIGQPDYQLSGFVRPGASSLYSCRDGRLLQRFIGGPGRSGSLGWGLAAGGDANGDGRPDLLLADPGFNLSSGLVSIVSCDPFLTADARVISAASGGTVTFTLDFPVSEAGLGYRLLASNTQVGERSVNGVAVPLLETGLMHRFFHRPPAAFSSTTGTLDAQGDAQIVLTMPAGAAAAWIGHSLKFAAISETAPGQPRTSSGPVFLDLLP